MTSFYVLLKKINENVTKVTKEGKGYTKGTYDINKYVFKKIHMLRESLKRRRNNE